MKPLREKMIKELELARLAPPTRDAYLRAVDGLARHYWRSPDRIRVEEIRAYLHQQLVERELAWSSCNVTACGLGFFYTKVLGQGGFRLELPPRTRPKTLPEVLSREEVCALLEALKNPKHRALLKTVYGGGLRVSEAIHLKVTDIDSKRMTIRVEQGKGRRDRYTILSERLPEELRAYWRIQRPPVWLFPGLDVNRPMTRASAQRIYYQAKKAAAIVRGHGIHTLRHNAGCRIMPGGIRRAA